MSLVMKYRTSQQLKLEYLPFHTECAADQAFGQIHGLDWYCVTISYGDCNVNVFQTK
jgi:hypothetical protein